jgi:hypothetical protein
MRSCPFCDSEPSVVVLNRETRIACTRQGCPIQNRIMTISAWEDRPKPYGKRTDTRQHDDALTDGGKTDANNA